MNLDLSIIIPVHNVEQYIEKCINSIQNNTVEIIIINDCSCDNSHQIIKNIIHNTNLNIKYINLQENIGTLAVRIRGIQQAQGSFVMFLDSDDWLESQSVERILTVIQSHDNLDLIQYDYCYNNGRTTWLPSKKSFIFNHNNEFIPYNIYGNYFMWQFVYRKSIFTQAIIDKLDIRLLMYEDVLVNHLILPHVKNIYIMEQTIYNYYMRTNSITNTYDNTRVLQNIADTYSVLALIQNKSMEYQQYYNYQADYWKNKVILSSALSHDIQLINQYNQLYDNKISYDNLSFISRKMKYKYYLHKFILFLLPLGSKRRSLVKLVANKIFHP